MSDPVEDLPVRFMPPLAHERQRWILETLSANHAQSVLDVGCGEGSLLNVLCKPAPSVPNDGPAGRDLELTRVAALDIDRTVIEDAVHSATYQRKPHYTPPWGSGEDGWCVRWAPLHVAVWLGQLEVLNPTFYGFDAIVSTEVIEHVPESVLPAFSHVLLGEYRPRLLLLTTPNYTFNARFHPPGVPRKGFPDPTGQTTRVFRHSDHKREWTLPEFEAWCREAADAHGYDLTLGGVGLPTEPDPFDRDLGYASQTALFVRREGLEAGMDRMGISAVYAPPDGPPHQLQVEQKFEADPRAGHPESARAIRDAVVYVMNMRGEGELMVSELWSELAMTCGGSVTALVDALVANNETDETDDTIGQWTILPPKNPNYYTDPRWDRVILWEGFVTESVRDEDQEYGSDDQTEQAQDYTTGWGSDAPISSSAGRVWSSEETNHWSGWEETVGDGAEVWGSVEINTLTK